MTTGRASNIGSKADFDPRAEPARLLAFSELFEMDNLWTSSLESGGPTTADERALLADSATAMAAQISRCEDVAAALQIWVEQHPDALNAGYRRAMTDPRIPVEHKLVLRKLTRVHGSVVALAAEATGSFHALAGQERQSLAEQAQKVVRSENPPGDLSKTMVCSLASNALVDAAGLVEVIEDGGYSGKNLRRPGIAAALESLRAHRADTLVVATLDRLSRSMLDFAGLMERASHEHWALVALDLGVDTTTPSVVHRP